MEILINLAQIVLAGSVFYVWIIRYENVVKEFKHFEINDLTRNFVGASKIALATLLITGIWYPSLILVSSLLMGFFMLSAQYFHFKFKSPFIKRLPSLFLLLLSAIIALSTIQ